LPLESNSKKFSKHFGTVFGPLLCIGLAGMACQRVEEKKAEPIAIEDKIFDITIQSAFPDAYNYSDNSAQVGIASNGQEVRVLIDIPEILNLYRPDVVLSSIANIEIHIKAAAVKVNPDNIRLSFLADTWTPYATWNSRFALAPTYAWANPGGDVLDGGGISPSIEKVAEGGQDKNLVFNLTQAMIKAVADQTEIHGFLLQVLPGSSNASDILPIYTSNSSPGYAPKAYLTLNHDEVIVP
jgi:hypothetical protein